MALSNWHSTALMNVDVIRQYTPLPVMVIGFSAYIVGHIQALPYPHCNNNRAAS